VWCAALCVTEDDARHMKFHCILVVCAHSDSGGLCEAAMSCQRELCSWRPQIMMPATAPDAPLRWPAASLMHNRDFANRQKLMNGNTYCNQEKRETGPMQGIDKRAKRCLRWWAVGWLAPAGTQCGPVTPSQAHHRYEIGGGLVSVQFDHPNTAFVGQRTARVRQPCGNREPAARWRAPKHSRA